MSSPYRIHAERELDEETVSEPDSANGLTLALLALGGLRVVVALFRHELCGTEVGLAAGLVAMAVSDLGNRVLGKRIDGNRQQRLR